MLGDEEIRSFIKKFEETHPYPESKNQEYEWWVTCMVTYVQNLRYGQSTKLETFRADVAKIGDKFHDIRNFMDECILDVKENQKKL